MATGMKLWDAAGRLTMDTTTWTGQILGSFSLGANHGAGSINNAGLAQGRPWVAVFPYDGNTGSTAQGNPSNTSASVTGTTLNYTAGISACIIIFGIR